MNYRMILSLLGKMMLVGAAVLVAPVIVSLIYNDGEVVPFLYTIGVSLVIGAAFTFLIKPKKTDIYAKEGMVIVALTWIMFSVIGGLPFYFSKEIPSIVDCIFETASGFSTTGSTILTNVEAMTKSMQFWRSFTHWIGGMGVLVFATAILSNKNARTTYIMRAEMAGPKVGKLVAKWQFSIRILYGIYIALSALEFIFLLFGGMSVFDSLVHTFGTAGTGGFGIWNNSIGHYESAYIDYVISIFMLLFGVNFNIYYLLIIRQFIHVKNNSEIKLYIGIVAAATVMVTANIARMYGGVFTGFRYALFQVSAIITTTGYATADFSTWPMFSQIVLFLLMFVGGCAGSTGGGLKVIRVSILAKSAYNSIKQSFRPKNVLTVKNDGKPIENSIIYSVLSYIAVYIVVMVASIIIISLDKFDFETTITSVVTAVNNIGPGLGSVIGPAGNFSGFSPLSKLVLTFDMLAGRLELMPMLVVFSSSLWRK